MSSSIKLIINRPRTCKYSIPKTMKKILGSIGIATCLIALLPVLTAQAKPTKVKSFAEWCQQKDTVPAATKQTIDILLKEAGTEDCKLADRQLKTLTDLDISGNEISDVKPLAGLTNLTQLNLDRNKIVDVKSLSGLTNLTQLGLALNQINDVKPLAGLTKLDLLYLYNNQIGYVKPLAGLTNLTYLSIGENKIVDVKPLAGLTNLTDLRLDNNPLAEPLPGRIAAKVCPVKPESICKF